jgi:hypothetical protein
MTRKAAGKHPAPEGPSQKKKSTDSLGTGGPLIIDDEEYALTANYVAEQYARRHTKYAPLGIQLLLKLIECLEGLVEVIDQGRGNFGLDHYIVNICLNELISDLVLEALLDDMVM